MMTRNPRRCFFKQFILEQAARCMKEFQAGFEEADREADLDRFFESYESSYALTLAYPDEILLETARRNGIEVTGRDKLDIVKELFLQKGSI